MAKVMSEASAFLKEHNLSVDALNKKAGQKLFVEAAPGVLRAPAEDEGEGAAKAETEHKVDLRASQVRRALHEQALLQRSAPTGGFAKVNRRANLTEKMQTLLESAAVNDSVIKIGSDV